MTSASILCWTVRLLLLLFSLQELILCSVLRLFAEDRRSDYFYILTWRNNLILDILELLKISQQLIETFIFNCMKVKVKCSLLYIVLMD